MNQHNFAVASAIEVLQATPSVLRAMLGGLSDDWIRGTDESDDRAWDPFDVVGHLIHGEQTDWIPRARIILEQGEDRAFEPFDRFAQFEASKGKSLGELLDQFQQLREESLETLRGWNLSDEELALEGIHPQFGDVTLRQLLSTWVVHDLNHIRQIATSMASRYATDVGPWREYLSILK